MIEQHLTRIQAVAPVQMAGNDTLLVEPAHALAVARFLRDDPQLRLDYASNVTGVDWLDLVTKEKVKVATVVDGVEKEVEETVEKKRDEGSIKEFPLPHDGARVRSRYTSISPI